MVKLENLQVDMKIDESSYITVKDVSLEIPSRECFGIVGESGCGKSISAYAMMGLLPEQASVRTGRLSLNDTVIENMAQADMRSLRGKEIAMIFQEPMTSLNPLMTVGKQVQEAYLAHHNCSKEQAKIEALDIMRKVGLSRVEKLYGDYPHKLSGGMRQRIVIAIALVNNPAVLIADEPTTALDVTIQHQILQLLKTLNQTVDSSIIFISHDLGIIKELCKNAAVMYAGYIVESGAVEELFRDPKHPYTKGLLASIPSAVQRGKKLHSIEGIVPSLTARDHQACCFADRCQYATGKCRQSPPPLFQAGKTMVRCFLCEQDSDDVQEKGGKRS